MLVTDSQDQLDILERIPGTGWRLAQNYDIPAYTKYQTTVQPGFAWAPYDEVGDPYGPGHWWIVYPTLRQDKTTGRIEALRLDHVDSFTPQEYGQFHNHWTNSKPATGVYLLDHPGDTNLHGASISPAYDDDGTIKDEIRFYPFADGEWDLEFRGANDWSLMDGKACLKMWNANQPDDRPCNHPNSINMALDDEPHGGPNGEDCDL